MQEFGILSPGKNRKFRLDLFADEEKKKEGKEKETLEKKLQKYRKKYLERQEKISSEGKKYEELGKITEEAEGKIGLLSAQIMESQEVNKVLSLSLAKCKAELNSLFQSEGLNSDYSKDFLEIRPSLSSLQFDNLQEKLSLKNKRIEELEQLIALENNKTADLLNEISLLKSQLT